MFLVRSGFSTTETFYTVWTQDPFIQSIISQDRRFLLVDDPNADIIVEVSDMIHVFSTGSDRSRAALYFFEETLKNYNKQVVEEYPEEQAYPLRVELEMLDREDKTLDTYFEFKPPEETSRNETNVYTNVQRSSLLQQREQELQQEETEEAGLEEEEDIPELEGAGIEMAFVEKEYALPENLNPFSQLKTLFMVIFMTIPISMITVVYSNSLMSEKMNKRGIFFLVSPVKTYEVIIGKTIPYLLASFIAALPIIIYSTKQLGEIIGSSIVLLSVLLIYLAIGFLSAMLSRSHKELSFLSIFFVSLYSCYLLIPSFLVNISFISLASPLSIIVKLFQHEIVPLKLFLFTIIPSFVAGFALYFFGIKLFNDEDMFSYRKLMEKIMDALRKILKNYWNLATITFFSVPFVFLIELMMIVFLVSIKSFFSIYILMILAALVEESFRNIGLYTIISRKMHHLKLKHLLLYSFLSGFGFFLGEKAILLIMIAPFVEAYFTLIVAGVFTPLILHSALSFVFALLSKHLGKKSFGTSIAITTLLHFIINFTLYTFLGK